MTIKYTRSARLEAVSSLQLKHRWYTDVQCQQESVGFAASSGEMSLFSALHGHSPCARLWRVGSAWLLGGTQSSMWMSHATGLFFSPGSGWEKEPDGMRDSWLPACISAPFYFTGCQMYLPTANFLFCFVTGRTAQGDSAWEQITRIFVVLSSAQQGTNDCCNNWRVWWFIFNFNFTF